MNIGKLDRLITLQAPTVVPQSPNGELAPKAFADVAQVWAGLYYAQGNEAVQASEVTATQRIVFTIRYRADVRPTWQLVHEGRAFQITDVAEIGRRQGHKLTCYSHG